MQCAISVSAGNPVCFLSIYLSLSISVFASYAPYLFSLLEIKFFVTIPLRFLTRDIVSENAFSLVVLVLKIFPEHQTKHLAGNRKRLMFQCPLG